MTSRSRPDELLQILDHPCVPESDNLPTMVGTLSKPRLDRGEEAFRWAGPVRVGTRRISVRRLGLRMTTGTVGVTASPHHQPTNRERSFGCRSKGRRWSRSPADRDRTPPSWRRCGAPRSLMTVRPDSSACSPIRTTRSSVPGARSHGAPRRARSRPSSHSRRARRARSGTRQRRPGGCSGRCG